MQAPAVIDSERQRKRKRRLIYLLAGVLVFVFIILPAAALTGLWITERQKRAQEPQQVEVPNLIGQDYKSVESLLKGVGLSVRVNAMRADTGERPGVVLDQVPLGGNRVPVNYVVGVVVSGPPERFKAQIPPEGVPAQAASIIVSVDERGVISISVDGGGAEAVDNVGELRARLEQLIRERGAERSGRAVTVKASPKLKYEDVRKVVGAAKGAGAYPVGLETGETK